MTGSVVRVRGIQRFVNKRTGREYCYHRASGTRIDAPFGSPEFFAQLAKVDRDHSERQRRDKAPKTLGDAITEYLASTKFRTDLSPRTQRDYQNVLAQIDKLHAVPLAAIKRPWIAKLRDSHAAAHSWHAANYLLQVLAQVFKTPVEYGVIPDNPAMGVSRVPRPRDLGAANRPWTRAERAAMLDAAAPHMRLPLAIGMLTGLRIEDIITLPRTAFSEKLTPYDTRKRGVEVFLARTAEIRAEISRAPKHDAITLCANSHGKPWTTDGLRTNFQKLRAKLEADGSAAPGLTIHGLRHTVAGELAEYGLTDAEIALWLGHKTVAMARKYSSRADKKRRMENVVVKLRRRGKLRT